MTAEAIAQYVAPAATMLAAMMTAANLGARITGFGFVIFTIGSIAWSILGIATGQTELVVTNGFLTFVNLVGVWRWLGRQKVYEDGATSAAEKSRRSAGPELIAGAGLPALPLADAEGRKIGHGVDILLRCDDQQVSYVVVALTNGDSVSERLVAIAPQHLEFRCNTIVIRKDEAWLTSLKDLPDGDWPDATQALGQADPGCPEVRSDSIGCPKHG